MISPPPARADGQRRPHGWLGRRRAPGARARIVTYFLVVVAAAMALSLVITGQLLLARADSRAATELAHEATKLRAFAQSASSTAGSTSDSAAGSAAGSAADGTAGRIDALLSRFLREVLPDHDETFFSVVDGLAAHRSATPPAARLDLDATVVAWAAAADAPQSRTFPSTAGEALVGVLPVRLQGDPTPGAIVVVEFLEPARTEAWTLIRLIALISAGSLMVAGAAASLAAGRVLRPVREMRLAAAAITETDLSRRIEATGNDDVAELAHTFNNMVDRLESAFTAQREFLDDAGHELRTPLTVIRGHLELMGDDPAERAQTTALLLDEIDRMRRLIDDLILLAQAERPDFLLPTETDLADLVIEAVAKAQALAPRQWRIDEVAEGTIRADGQRLTQALMQLCSNAVAQTKEGDTIAVGSRMTLQHVRLWVRDTGAGVDPADARRIFSRAVRGSGERVGSGSGLGLAIVSGIARAHGGFVILESQPGAGATFILELPRGEGTDGSAAS